MLEMSLGSNNLWSTPELSKLQPMGKIWSTAHSVNKVLLEHSHSYLFTHLEPQQNFGEICLFILLHFNFPTNTYQAPTRCRALWLVLGIKWWARPSCFICMSSGFDRQIDTDIWHHFSRNFNYATWNDTEKYNNGLFLFIHLESCKSPSNYKTL